MSGTAGRVLRGDISRTFLAPPPPPVGTHHGVAKDAVEERQPPEVAMKQGRPQEGDPQQEGRERPWATRSHQKKASQEAAERRSQRAATKKAAEEGTKAAKKQTRIY